jgi:hypothetical protein
MVALGFVPISAETGLKGPAVKPNRLSPIIVASCLFLLMVFSMSTMFVREAWALQSFQIEAGIGGRTG